MRRMVFVLFVLAAMTAMAQGPSCQDPNRPPGACFEQYPFGWFILVPGPDGITAAGPIDQQAFTIVLPPGKTRTHAIDKDVTIMYCTPTMVADGTCDPNGPPPPPDRIYFGTGRINANYTYNGPDPESACPVSIHINGEVRSSGGEQFYLRATAIRVKDQKSPTGCRELANEVTLRAR